MSRKRKSPVFGGAVNVAMSAQIKAARIEKGWSQAVLGEKVGMGQGRISAIEHGNVKLTVPMLEALADGLGKRLVVGFEDKHG